MHCRKLFVALSAIVLLAASSCGGTHLASNTPDFSAVQGNWQLTSPGPFPGDLSQGPIVTLAIGRSGNTIYAVGDTTVTCSQNGAWMDGPISGVGAPVTAAIASDGSFLLTNASSPDSPIQFAIRGAVPVVGASTWKGTYTLFNAASSKLSCDFHQSGSFEALAYPPFQGTYSGTVSGPGFQSGIGLSLQVAQGEPTIIPAGQPLSSGLIAAARFYLPLSGTIAITGSPCFTTGAFASDGNSVISGDRFTILATMNDGTPVLVTGWFYDRSETTLTFAHFEVMGRSSCAGSFGNGSLTVQP